MPPTLTNYLKLHHMCAHSKYNSLPRAREGLAPLQKMELALGMYRIQLVQGRDRMAADYNGEVLLSAVCNQSTFIYTPPIN